MRLALPPAIDPEAVRGHDPAAPVVALAGATMGTGWRVLCALPGGVSRDAVRDVVEARLAALVAELSHWDADSLLSRFNRSAAGSWTALPVDFAAVMAVAMRVAEASGGAFDPAVGRLVDLWGFGPPGARPAPDEAALAEARRGSGWRRLAWDEAASRLRQSGGLALDLSGVAKGLAVDRVADALAGLGVRHALVEIGGELAGRGLRPDGDPWWVELEDPPGVSLIPIRIALHQMAVATSGDYRRGAHNLDPRTGRPAASGCGAVSVIADNAALADAWATALFVLGPGEGLAMAAAQGLAARFVGHDGGEVLSPALVAMLA